MFIVEGAEFGWDEIVAAAQVWGEWQPFVERTRQSLACLLLAAETGQLPTGAETRETVTAFRYAHNLISAEETQTWLSEWGMTVEDWMNCLRGQLLRERWAKRARYKVAWVVDMSALTDVPATQRRMFAEHMTRFEDHDNAFNQGSAVVVPNALLRGIATAVFWLQRPKFPLETFSTQLDAIAWAETRLREGGVAMSASAP